MNEIKLWLFIVIGFMFRDWLAERVSPWTYNGLEILLANWKR